MGIKPTMNCCLKDEHGKEYTIKEWVDYTISCGFDTMEIPTHRLPEDLEELDDVITYAQQKGFALSLHSPYGSNNITDTNIENREKSIAQAKNSIDIAAKYGMRVVTFHPGRRSQEDEAGEEKWKLLLEIVADIAAYAKEKKVRVGLENMERRRNELVYTIDDLNRFAEIGKDNPYFGLTLDFAHFSSHGITDPDLKQLKLPIHNVHLSQGVEGKMHFPLTAENGMVDVDAVCRRLTECDYDGFAVFEQLGYQKESKKMVEDAVKAVNEV